MEFMNIVRFEIKEGKFDEWQSIVQGNFAKAMEMGGVPGMLETRHLKFGDNKICVIGRWESKEALMNARPMLIQSLGAFRHLLVEKDGEVTDPISGGVIFSTNQ